MKKLTFKSLTLALTLTLILTTCFLGGAFAVSADDENIVTATDSHVVYSDSFDSDSGVWKSQQTVDNSGNSTEYSIADGSITLNKTTSCRSAVYLSGDAYIKTEQRAYVDYTMNSTTNSPAVWLRYEAYGDGSYSKGSQNRGYYVQYNNNSGGYAAIYKWVNGGGNTAVTSNNRIATFGQNLAIAENTKVRIELVAQGNSPTLLSAKLYTYDETARAWEVSSQMQVVDNTTALQEAGTVALSTGAGSAGAVVEDFAYTSTDGVTGNYYIERSATTTNTSFLVFGQVVVLDPSKNYTLEVLYDENVTNYETPWVTYATSVGKGANAANSRPIYATTHLSKITKNGLTVMSSSFTLSDSSTWSHTATATIPKDKGDIYWGQNIEADPLVNGVRTLIGVRLSGNSAKSVEYTKFKLYETDDANKTNLLVNPDFKMGLYGWSDDFDVTFTGYDICDESSSATENSYVLLKSISDISSTFKFGTNNLASTTGDTDGAINTDSLIYGKIAKEYENNLSDTVPQLTDGVNTQRMLGSVATLTFEMDGYTKVEGVRIINQNNSSEVTRLGKYEIYVSNSLDSLYNAENKVAEVESEEVGAYWTTFYDTITFSEDYAKTGKYIGFNIVERSVADPDGATAINEIEVTGTKCATVTATAGVGGTITPAGATLLDGTAVEYVVTADDGYKVAEVLVNGEAAELTDGKYTFAGTETGWNTIEATFVLKGDANNDGSLNETDLTVIKQHILEISTANEKYADLDGDGDIDLLDLVTAYEIQQGISPAVTSLMTALELTNVEYNAALDRASAYNTSATDTARLNAVFEKAKNGGEITVAAIGGSITEGAGNDVITNVSVSPESLGAGTAFENSKYVDRVVNWFDTTFENATVNKVNAGISGTPSFFGTFRLEHDVLQHNPDLVIVEFSVNDLGNYELDDNYMLDAYESVIRKCLESESAPAVVAVFTVNNLTYTSTNIGNSWQNYHKQIAEHYNIPTISYHNAVYPNNEWITEWTKLSGDNVHPNVAGHALLANCITSYFEDVLEYESHTTAAVPTEWYHNDTFADTAIVYMGDAEFNGMIKTASTKYGTIATNAAGTGEESFTVQIPTGATEIYVFYHNVVREDKTDNSGSFYAKLGENAETGAYSTANLSINYSHGEWRRIYDGEALSEDTSLTIRSAADGKALHIISILVVK